MKTAALHYLRKYNYSVFPVSLSYDGEDKEVRKKPRIKWSQYQEEHPTEQQISMWWQLHANAGIGIVTGKINNLFVLDIDKEIGEDFVEDKLEDWPDPPKVRTGSGGSHIYFKYPSNRDVTVGARIGGNLEGKGLDFRCDGGFVVAPPSPYPSPEGKKYQWETTLEEGKLVKPPEWLLKAIEENGTGKAGQVDFKSILDGVEEGARNTSAAKVIGSLLKRFNESQWDLAWQTLKTWNRNRNDPPLEKEELRSVFENIVKKEKSNHTELEEISITNGVTLMNTNYEKEEIISNGILAPGQLALLIGPPKTGKTLLALDMLLAIANNKAVSWLDFPIDEHCNSLFLSGEGGGLLLQERLKKRSVEDRTMKNVNFWWPKDREKIKFNKGEHIAEIVKAVNKTKSKILFVDPFIKFHELDENSTQDMASIMDALWDIREQTGAAVVMVHHTRKGGLESRDGSLQETRGSSVSTGEVDTGLILSRRKGHNKMDLDFELRWAEEPKTHELKLEQDLKFSVVSQYRRGGDNKKIKAEKRKVEEILHKYNEEWLTVKEISNELDVKMSKSTVRKKLNNLVDTNKAKKEKGVREEVHGNKNCYKIRG